MRQQEHRVIIELPAHAVSANVAGNTGLRGDMEDQLKEAHRHFAAGYIAALFQDERWSERTLKLIREYNRIRNLGRADATTRTAKEGDDEVHNVCDRLATAQRLTNRQDRGNRFRIVIRLLSFDAWADWQKHRKWPISRLLQDNQSALAKGNIHPLATTSLLAPGAISAGKGTAATVITGQTDQVVSRISSAPVSGCYQQNTMLPAKNRGRKYAHHY